MASPIYQQIAGTLRQRINSGKYAEGDQIPALEKLTEEFGVSRMTVIKAIDSIEAQGYVQRFQGRGT
ncbi:MAG: GntR family transcriptional regulator, partial [Rhodospirillales bacterium]